MAETAGTVLVAGSVNTDLVARVRVAPAPGETVTGSGFAIFGGGKGANQAVAAARSGARTAMLGAVGRDDFGRQRVEDLTAEGISVAHIAQTGDAPSGVALILVEDDGQNRIAYVPGATLTVTAAAAVRAVEDVRPRVVLATLELPPPALDGLLTAARALGATVIVNATPEPKEGRDLAARADVLVVNQSEALELLGWDSPRRAWVDAALALGRLGPSIVIVTLGSEGALLAQEGSIIALPAPRVEVADTTGAGDALCGALAARMAVRDAPRDAARWAVVAGSLAVTRAGAQPSMPRHDEIARMVSEVEQAGDGAEGIGGAGGR